MPRSERLNEAAFPLNLRGEPHWGVTKGGKAFNPRTGVRAYAHQPASLGTFSEAAAAFNADEQWEGIAYLYPKGGEVKGSVVWRGPAAELVSAPREWKVNGNGKTAEGLAVPKLYTAADLQHTVLPEPVWAIDGFVPEGLTMLVAHSKIGKTFIAEDAAVAVALGGRAWGKIPVQQGTVIYLDTEGNRRRVQRRLNNLLGPEPWPADLLLTHECVTLDAQGFLVLKSLVLRHPGLRMMVLDTLNAMRPGKKQNGDLVKEDYDMIRALRTLGEEHHVAILLLHHSSLTTKSDTVNAGAGTHGLAAAASAVLTFHRARGEHDAIMDVTGNDIQEEAKHHFARDTRTGFWTLQGSGDHYMGTKLQQEIFDQVARSGKAMPNEVARALGKTADSIRKAMKRMAFSGELTCDNGYYDVPRTRN